MSLTANGSKNQAEEINIPKNSRLNIIGSTGTGKSRVVRDLLLKGSIICEGNIYIFAPTKISLEQNLWNGLEIFGFKVIKILIQKKSERPSIKSGDLLIFDDIDDAHKIPSWVNQIFTIDSHHLGCAAIKISHKVRCKDTLIRGSCSGTILFFLPEEQLSLSCKALFLKPDIIHEMLNDPKKLILRDNNSYDNHNAIYIDHTSLYKPGESKMRSRYYKINSDIIT